MLRYKLYIQLLVIIILVAVLAWFFNELVTYILIALVLSTILKPLTQVLRNLTFFNQRLPQAVAVMGSMLVLVGVLTGIVLIFVPLIVDQVTVLSSLNFDEILYSVDGPLRQIEKFLIKSNIVHERSGFLRKQLRTGSLIDGKSIYVSSVLDYSINLFRNVTISVIAVAFMTYFLLYERGILKRTFLRFVPNRYFELTLGALFKIERLLTSYLLGLLLQITGIFTLTSVGLLLLGVPYAWTIALFAAVINLIPYLGPLIGGAFSVIVALSTSPILGKPDDYIFLSLKVIGISASVHLVDNVIMQPFIFSRSVKAHPMEIFVAIFAGAAIADIIGMILAIPVYTVLRVVYKELSLGYERYSIFSLQSYT
jgi:predicted PurR-regulated permease PerM